MSRRRPNRERSAAAEPPSGAGPARDLDAEAPPPGPLYAAAATLLLVAGPLTPAEAGAEQGTHYLWTIGWLLLLAAPFAAAALRRKRLELRWRRADLLLLAGCLWMAATAAWRGGDANPRAGINMAWFWAGAGACLLALRQVGRPWLPLLAAVLIAAAAAQALHGAYQYAVVLPQMVRQYEQSMEEQKQEMLRASGVDTQPGSPSRYQFENRLRSTEPFATYGLANSLAGVLAPWLVVALGLLLCCWPERRKSVFLAAAAAAIAACLMLTKSRSAWLAAAGGVLALTVWDLQGRRRLGWRLPLAAAAAIICGALGGFLVGALDREVLTQAVLSLRYRVEYWQATGGIIAEHPLLGCGSGNFQDYYPQYKLPTASETVADPHNLLLELAATGGLPAAALMLAGWAAQLWPARRAAAMNDAPGSRPATPRADRPLKENAVWRGAVGGLLVGSAAALAFGYRHDAILLPVPWLFGAAALGGAWLSGPWTRRAPAERGGGESAPLLPAAVAKAGLAVVLVNLLAAGGVSFWAVLQTAVLLGVMADRGRPRRLACGRSGALAAVTLAAVLLASVQWTGLGPVLRGQLAMQRAAAAATPEQAASLLQAATEADPWSPTPWRMWAQMRAAAGQYDQTTERLIDEALRRDRRNHGLLSEVGRWRLQASRFGKREAVWRQAVEAYRQAYRLDPHGPAAARLAWALHWGGSESRQEARQLAAAALQWDASHPHQEQRLQQLSLPGPGGDSNAEQAMGILRDSDKLEPEAP